jgi:hypothetical protein
MQRPATRRMSRLGLIIGLALAAGALTACGGVIDNCHEGLNPPPGWTPSH